MSKTNDYNHGYQDGYWAGSGSAYDQGYAEGVQAERNRTKSATDGSLPTSEPSTLWSMVGGSIALTILGWCFAGLISFLGWIGGNSESWWFPWIWRIAFWGGIGFVVIMSIMGVAMTIIEHQEAKNPPKRLEDDPNLPWYKKYPPADVIKARKKKQH